MHQKQQGGFVTGKNKLKPSSEIAGQVVETAKTVRETVREKRMDLIDIPSPKDFFWDAFLGRDENIRVLQMAVEQTNDVILITDADWEQGPSIVFVNPAFTQLTGYTREEAIGKSPKMLQGARTDREMLKKLRKSIKKGEYFTAETVNYRKDGSEYYVAWHISPVRDSDGALTHYISIQRDVTRRHNMEEKLRRYTQDLEKEVKTKTRKMIQNEKMVALGMLVAGVAHEINNPLAYIKSNNGLMEELIKQSEDGGLSREQTDQLLELVLVNQKGFDRIATLTATLKRFAKHESKEKVLSDVNQGINDTLLLVYNRFKERVEVVEDLGQLPPVECNIGQLNQVFMNLVLNSIDAMDNGKITIKTYVKGKNVHIVFSDNGKGMPEDVVDNIFDPFFTTKAEGTGLGLSISYKIIQDHGGDIEVDSILGKGTTMHIRIPIRQEG